MPKEELEKLKQQQHKPEKKLTAAKHKKKQLEHKLKQLTRSERAPPPTLYSCRNVGEVSA